MEDTLGEKCVHFINNQKLRLNPCSNGRYSRREDFSGFPRELYSS